MTFCNGPRLREWIEEDRAGLRHTGALPRPPRRGAVGWRAENGAAPNELERGFLDASVELQARQVVEERERQHRELRRLRWFTAAVALVGVAAGLAAGQAYRHRKLSSSRELASVAVSNLDRDPEPSVLLALEAIARAETEEAEAILHHATKASRIRHTLAGHTSAVMSVAFSPDGARLATASDDRTAKVWDAESGEELFTLAGHTNWVLSVVFSPDGTRLATASSDRTAKVWDAASGAELFTLASHTDWVRSVALSPAGTRLATASDDRTVKVWDAASGEELFTFAGHTSSVRSVAFSPDGTHLATASLDNTAKVWDAESGEEFFTLAGHTAVVRSVAFSPDGTRLATASDDRTAKVWDAGSGEELFTLAGHTSRVQGDRDSPLSTPSSQRF